MIISLEGLHVFGYHGVEEEEKRLGQLFLYDVELDIGDRGITDRLDDAIDYSHVAAVIREISSERRFDLIEALANVLADRLMEQFQPLHLKLRIRKPQVKPAGLTVDFAAVTVERP